MTSIVVLTSKQMPILKHLIQQNVAILNLTTNKTTYSRKLDTMTKGSVTNFLKVSKAWDQGSKKTREIILKDFIQSHQNSTGPQLELDLVNGASLFLTRITAWLRLRFFFPNTNVYL